MPGCGRANTDQMPRSTASSKPPGSIATVTGTRPWCCSRRQSRPKPEPSAPRYRNSRLDKGATGHGRLVSWLPKAIRPQQWRCGSLTEAVTASCRCLMNGLGTSCSKSQFASALVMGPVFAPATLFVHVVAKFIAGDFAGVRAKPHRHPPFDGEGFLLSHFDVRGGRPR